MALNDPFELDPTSPTSNSNFGGNNIQEGCFPSGINNALRQLGSWLAQATSYQSAAMSSSVSTNIAATGTGLYMPIIGANTINSFGTVAGVQASAAVLRILEFSSSASISHGAKIALPGGAAIRTQPGDVLGLIHEGSADVWRGLFYTRADGSGVASSISATTITVASMSASALSTVTLLAASASITNIGITRLVALNSVSSSIGDFTNLRVGSHGVLAQRYIQSYTSFTSLSVGIPFDDTIPQNTEGAQLLTQAITPVNANSTIFIRASGMFGGSNAWAIMSLFVDATANALATTSMEMAAANITVTPCLEYSEAAGSTAARTYKLRAGPDTGNQIFTNGITTGRKFGGNSAITLVVEEMLPQ